MEDLKNQWDEICEKFNVEVADKTKTFVTATEFFNWLKANYNPPTLKTEVGTINDSEVGGEI